MPRPEEGLRGTYVDALQVGFVMVMGVGKDAVETLQLVGGQPQPLFADLRPSRVRRKRQGVRRGAIAWPHGALSVNGPEREYFVIVDNVLCAVQRVHHV